MVQPSIPGKMQRQMKSIWPFSLVLAPLTYRPMDANAKTRWWWNELLAPVLHPSQEPRLWESPYPNTLAIILYQLGSLSLCLQVCRHSRHQRTHRVTWSSSVHPINRQVTSLHVTQSVKRCTDTCTRGSSKSKWRFLSKVASPEKNSTGGLETFLWGNRERPSKSSEGLERFLEGLNAIFSGKLNCLPAWKEPLKYNFPFSRLSRSPPDASHWTGWSLMCSACGAICLSQDCGTMVEHWALCPKTWVHPSMVTREWESTKNRAWHTVGPRIPACQMQ